MREVFWVSFVALLYIYLGYPLAVWLLAALFGREPAKRPTTPSVSLLIPAYNEAAHIEQKLRNSLALDYPKDRLEIVVASDGSTDATNAIAERFGGQGIRLLAFEHLGKAGMLSRAVPTLRGEIVVFSDTSSQLEPESLRALVESFADPKVGCVSGLYRVKASSDLRAQGEGLYWRYETFIKRQESQLHSILGAHGAFYAIRTALFDLEPSAINDDYLIPMRIVARGYRAVYEPKAVSWELEAASVKGEFARRRRIAVGNCQQIVQLKGLLNPARGWVALSFFSHKVLRTLAPIFLVTLLMASFSLPQPLAGVMWGLQGALYLSAYLGYVCQQRGRMIRWLSPPLYFCLGNLAMLAGLWRFCFERHRPAWEN